MKHILIALIATVMFSCGTSKTIRVSKKIIKGNWTLNNISYSKTGAYNVTLLNDAPKGCFEGSNWQFIPNNNTGIYTITKNNCTVGGRYFNFVIQEVNETTGLYDFLLKPTDNKGRSETNSGFRLNLTSLSETSMQWQQTVYADGVAFIINMNFTKTQ